MEEWKEQLHLEGTGTATKCGDFAFCSPQCQKASVPGSSWPGCAGSAAERLKG